MNKPKLPAEAHLAYVLHLTSPLSETYSVDIVSLTFLFSFSPFYTEDDNSTAVLSAINLSIFLRASEVSPVIPIILVLSSTNFYTVSNLAILPSTIYNNLSQSLKYYV
jgi:hypothetical protein